MRVIMTGGATGIGAALVTKLKAAGHEVTACDISQPAQADRWIQINLSDPASIDQALSEIDGTYDALINNAGLPPREGLAETILKVNFFGMRHLLDGMLDKLAAGASIVNTASRAGLMWRQNLDQIKALMALDPSSLADFLAETEIDATRAYNLSKEAVIVMTLARTEDMIARNLRMNAVSPAAVSTGILDDFVTAFGPKVAENIARVGRPALPEEVADVILYLISPESHWIKGTNIEIDGGMGALAQTAMLDLG